MLRLKIMGIFKLFCFNPFTVVLGNFSGPTTLLRIGIKKFIIVLHLTEASLRVELDLKLDL